MKGNIGFLTESFIGENTCSIIYVYTHTHLQRKWDKKDIVLEDQKKDFSLTIMVSFFKFLGEPRVYFQI